ncbi:sporulation protein YunB [Tumebacillus algifaecis]|nr:sporulation protein YunB [Tumebacillus algifaecis]
MAMKIRGAKKRVNWRFIFFALLVMFVFSIVQSIYFVEHNLHPTFVKIAEENSRHIATEAINNSIAERISEETNYNKLVDLKTNAGGKVTAGYFNMIEASRIQNDVTKSIQTVLHSLQEKKLYIPAGQAFGSAFLSQFGPDIPVTIKPVGTIKSEIGWETRDQGINQTVHILYLDINVHTSVIIPFSTTPSDVRTKVPIAYVFLVGEVPQMVFNAKGETIGQTTSSQGMPMPSIQLPKLNDDDEEE